MPQSTASPVRYFIRLKLRQAWRFFPQYDIHPLVGCVIAVGILTALIATLFHKPYPGWSIAGVGTALAVSLQNASQNEYLRQMLHCRQYYQCRMAEVAMIVLPFALVLLVSRHWLPFLVLIASIPLLGFINLKIRLPFKALPTPFPKYAVEFHAVFRRAFPVFILYGLSVIPATLSGNANIFFAGFILAALSLCGAFGELEQAEMIVIYRSSPGKFLWQKIRMALLCYGVLAATILIPVLVFFRAEALIAGSIVLFAVLPLVGCLLLKYQFHPNALAVGLGQCFFIVLSLIALMQPPFLLLLVLFLVFSFFRARRNLQALLPC